MWDFELSVTICSWNTLADTRACLQSLSRVRGEADFEVIVVDNNSEDGSADMVATEFPWVRLMRMSKNLGFTGGHNTALANRRGRHAFLLNSDAIVHPGALKALLTAANADPDIGVIGPKVLNPDGSLQLSCRRFPNPVAALFRSTPLERLFPNVRVLRDYLMADMDHSATQSVDWVSGCAMLLTERLLRDVGAFDPDFFMYCEDTDLCKRAWDAGLKVVYLPEAVVTHAIGRSTDKAVNRMLFRHSRSMLLYYRKHVISKQNVFLRPLLWMVAAIGLNLRVGMLIWRNKRDARRRRAQHESES